MLLASSLLVAIGVGAACSSFSATENPGANDAGGESDGSSPGKDDASPAKDSGTSADAGSSMDADTSDPLDVSPCEGGVLGFKDDFSNGLKWKSQVSCPNNDSNFGDAGATLECDGPMGAYNVLQSMKELPPGTTQVLLRVSFLDPGPDGGPLVRHVVAQLLAASSGGNIAISYDSNKAKLFATDNTGSDFATWDVAPGPHSIRIALPQIDAGNTSLISVSVDNKGGTPLGNVSRTVGALQVGPYMVPVAGHARDRYLNARFWSCP